MNIRSDKMNEIEGKILNRFYDKITIKSDDNQEYSIHLSSLLSDSDIVEYFINGKRIKITGIINEIDRDITEIKEIWLKIL